MSLLKQNEKNNFLISICYSQVLRGFENTLKSPQWIFTIYQP